MESLTRLVTDSLARHGFDRPIDPRRLQWSRWFRCDSPHSLLVVPSKPGIFAIAEEIGASVARAPSPAMASTFISGQETLGGAAFARCDLAPQTDLTLAAEAAVSKRMLAVIQFSEDDDMAFTLDRMFTRINPMRTRLSSGCCFLRFVVIEDQDQRRNICSALNQWMLTSAEKASGIPAAFSSSLELNTTEEMAGEGTGRVGRSLLSVSADRTRTPAPKQWPGREADHTSSAPALDSGVNKNLHCPDPLPSGF
ncbi:MAG TPA: hypothetical protein VN901_26980 [Candidatus Acidoferrales bacterium]|nr:hypothetical protein [Candidatus Acidoferrales bacterium]